ncbi:hypothetical protein PIB30_073841 [Stylosanthes scabra]|uniref:Uncharacterized protein n=1 Tax=Stylosanthes scabra TaxID=79078 RepID=A0ABU6VNZ3_9FABA|nr:hypothetical protein [Stylosanthes scabra]
MNVLDSQVEALAFNYLSFGALTVLNNLWTWLALLTAAFSFWKIRSSGCPEPEISDPTREPITEAPIPEAVTPSPPVESVTVSDVVPLAVTDDVDGVRKGKFTVYYEEEGDDDDAQCMRGEREGSLTLTLTEGCEGEWWEKWERLLRLRNGVSEDGWYTCQDLTELNGNVVRLWDGGFRCRESWYSYSCVDLTKLCSSYLSFDKTPTQFEQISEAKAESESITKNVAT